MSDTGSLYFEAGIDSDKFYAELKTINQRLKLMGDTAVNQGQRMDTIFKRAGQALGAYLSIGATSTFFRDMVRVRGEFQQLEVAYETMLKDKAKADRLMNQTKEFAMVTPFELKDVAKGVKQLLAFQVEAENTIPTMRMLGDLASGLGTNVNDLVQVYGKVKAKGKLQAEEMNLFLERGIPLVSELAKQFGVAEEKVYDMASKGQVRFENLEQVLKSLTSQGGMFAGMMEKQSKTITGQISNLQDAWDNMMNSLGKSNEGTIYNMIGIAKDLVENYETVIDIIKTLVATYGAYKAAVIAVNIAQNTQNIIGNAKAWFELAKEIKTAKDAQVAFNLATKANPIGLAAGAIALVVSGLVLFNKETSKAAKFSTQFSSELEEETKKCNDLFSELKKTKEGTDARTTAIKKINDKYKDYLPNLIKEKDTLSEIAEAQDKAVKAIAKSLAFKTQQKQIEDSKDEVDTRKENFYDQLEDYSKGLSAQQKGKLKAIIEEYKEEIRKSYDKLGYFSSSITTELMRKFREVSGGKSVGGLKVTDLELAIEGLIIKEKEFEKVTKEVKESYNAYLTELFGEGKKKETTPKSFDKEKASIQELQDQIKRLSEDKGKDNKAEIADLEQLILKKEKELQVRDEINTRIKELKTLRGKTKAGSTEDKAYETRIHALENKLGKKEAKTKEASLKIAKQLSDLEFDIWKTAQEKRIALMKEGKEKRKALAQLEWTEEMRRIGNEQEEYLKNLNEKNQKEWEAKGNKGKAPLIEKLPENVSAAFQAQIDAVNKELQKVINPDYEALLEKYKTYAQQKLEEIKKLQEDEKLLREAGHEEEANGIKKKIDKIKKEMNQKTLESSDLWKRLFGDITEYSSSTIDKIIEDVENYIKTLKDSDKAISVEGLKAIMSQLNKLKSYQRKDNPFKQLKADSEKFFDALKKGSKEDAGKSLENMNKSFKSISDQVLEMGEALEGAFTGGAKENMAEINEKLQGTVKTLQGGSELAAGILTGNPMMMIQGATDMITGLGKLFSKSDKEAEKAARRAEVLSQTNEIINNLLERRIGLLKQIQGLEYSIQEATTKQMLNNQKAFLDQQVKNSIAFLQKNGKNNNLNLKDLGIFSGEDAWDAFYGDKAKEILDLLQNKGYKWENLDEIKAIADAYGEILDAQEELEKNNQEILTGSNWEEAVDTFVDNFLDGSKTAADTFEDMLKNAIKQALIYGEMQEAMKEWYDEFTDYVDGVKNDPNNASEQAVAYNQAEEAYSKKQKELQDIESKINNFQHGSSNYYMYKRLLAQKEAIENELKEAEKNKNEAKKNLDAALKDSDEEYYEEKKKELQDKLEQIQEDTEKRKKLLEDEFGVSLDSDKEKKGKAGALRAEMTEESASELVGLWNGTSLDIREQLNMQRNMVSSLFKIEANTANTVVELKNAVTELKAINSNTSSSSYSSSRRDQGY